MAHKERTRKKKVAFMNVAAIYGSTHTYQKCSKVIKVAKMAKVARMSLMIYEVVMTYLKEAK